MGTAKSLRWMKLKNYKVDCTSKYFDIECYSYEWWNSVKLQGGKLDNA